MFINFSKVAAMLSIMAKLKFIFRLKCVKTWEFQNSLRKKVEGNDNSAIKEHLLFCNHSSGFEDVSILTINNNDLKVFFSYLHGEFLINRDNLLFNKNKQILL